MTKGLSSPPGGPNRSHLPVPANHDTHTIQNGGEDGLLAHLHHAVLQVSRVCLDRNKASAVSRSPTSSAFEEEDGDRGSKSSDLQCTQISDLIMNHQATINFTDIVSRLTLWGDAMHYGRAEATSILSPALYQNALALLFDCGKSMEMMFRILFGGKLEEQHRLDGGATAALDLWLERASFVLEGTSLAEKDPTGQKKKGDADASVLIDRTKTSDNQYKELVESLDDNTELLMDLLPSIEHILDAADVRPADGQLPGIAFEVSEPARIWISQIADKYSQASKVLVERLGEANWQRFCRLRMRQDDTLAHQLGQAKSVFHAPSTLHAPSAFHDSAIGTTIEATSEDSRSVVSHRSFASTATDDSHHFNRVPPEPEEVALAKPFVCSICHTEISNIRNRIDWKLHVFKDLRPYICLHEVCTENLLSFTTRKAWAEHELKVHRQEFAYECQDCRYFCKVESDFTTHIAKYHARLNSSQRSALVVAAARAQVPESREWLCPLCAESGFQSAHKFTSHVCRHMEDIALGTLPRQIYGNDEEDLKSEGDNYSIDQNPDISGFNSQSALDLDNSNLPTLDASNILDSQDSIARLYPQYEIETSSSSRFSDLIEKQEYTAAAATIDQSSTLATQQRPGSISDEHVTPTPGSTDVVASQTNVPTAGSSTAPGPIPATTPLVVRQDNNGVQWIAFEYSRDRVKLEYTIRCDIESVDTGTLDPVFKTENCVYPRACVPPDQYKGNRFKYESDCNQVGWALAELNPCLREKRGLIQRAVDSWRSSNQDPRLRSRRVRRMAKMNSKPTASTTRLPQSTSPIQAGFPGPSSMPAPGSGTQDTTPSVDTEVEIHPI